MTRTSQTTNRNTMLMTISDQRTAGTILEPTQSLIKLPRQNFPQSHKRRQFCFTASSDGTTNLTSLRPLRIVHHTHTHSGSPEKFCDIFKRWRCFYPKTCFQRNSLHQQFQLNMYIVQDITIYYLKPRLAHICISYSSQQTAELVREKNSNQEPMQPCHGRIARHLFYWLVANHHGHLTPYDN